MGGGMLYGCYYLWWKESERREHEGLYPSELLIVNQMLSTDVLKSVPKVESRHYVCTLLGIGVVIKGPSSIKDWNGQWFYVYGE